MPKAFADGAAVCSALSKSDCLIFLGNMSKIFNIQSGILGNKTSSPGETNKGGIKGQRARQHFACGR